MTASVCVPDLLRRAKGRDSWFMKRNLHSKRTRPSYHTLTRRISTSGLVRHGQALEASYNMAHYGRSHCFSSSPLSAPVAANRFARAGIYPGTIPTSQLHRQEESAPALLPLLLTSLPIQQISKPASLFYSLRLRFSLFVPPLSGLLRVQAHIRNYTSFTARSSISFDPQSAIHYFDRLRICWRRLEPTC